MSRPRPERPEVVILAGGHSHRLGRDKLAEIIEGRSLLQRAVDAALPLAQRIFVVTSPGRTDLPLAPSPQVTLLHDLLPDRGPLGGFYAGLHAIQGPACLLLAGDLPFLDPSLLQLLWESLPGWEAVVPEVGGRLHPLVASYARSCLAAVETALQARDHRMTTLLERVQSRILREDDLPLSARSDYGLFNVNTAADLAQARSHAGSSPPLRTA